jgi:hypothetical protein
MFMDYGTECVIQLANGQTIRADTYDSNPAGSSYVRVCAPDGDEIAYWTYTEWAEDPQLVMGAILGAAAGSQRESLAGDEGDLGWKDHPAFHMSAGTGEDGTCNCQDAGPRRPDGRTCFNCGYPLSKVQLGELTRFLGCARPGAEESDGD